VNASGNSKHQLHGFPVAAWRGSTTQAVAPSTAKRWRTNPRHWSTRPPGQGEAAGLPFVAVVAEGIVGVEGDEVVSFGSAAFRAVDAISKKAQQSHGAQGGNGMFSPVFPRIRSLSTGRSLEYRGPSFEMFFKNLRQKR
jgi:hypothetical protein